MPLTDFHPAVAAWFSKRFGAPTVPQGRAWPEIRAGRHTLIAAPTGSGKTLAAFLSAIDDLVRQALLNGGLPDETEVVYVSPLKALSNDVEKNLWEPLAGIREELAALGLPDVEIRTAVRTGDTPSGVRTGMIKKPPHILVTTPESLFILLTSDGGRRMLSTVRTVIVDEIHAVADDKRGSHLSLSLERLEALVSAPHPRPSSPRPSSPAPSQPPTPGEEGEQPDPSSPQPSSPLALPPTGRRGSKAGTPQKSPSPGVGGWEGAGEGAGGEGLGRGNSEAAKSAPIGTEGPEGGKPLLRIGLSATQSPIEEVARFLVGAGNVAPDGAPNCVIVDAGHGRRLDLAVEVPASSPLEAVMANEVWDEYYDRLAELIREHRTTLVFANTRRLAERVTRHLSDRLGEEKVASHHGSLAKEHRLESERRLKAGELSALVATASLELGIDIGSVDLVCQLGSTRSIATLLQRVGRSGHQLGGLPKGRLFPLTRDELVECAALVDAVRRGELDRLIIPERPLDILAQQIVAEAAVDPEDGRKEDDLFAMVRRSWPFRNLERKDFDEVVAMLSTGFTTRRGRRGAYLHHDAVNGVIRARKGARLTAITSGGAIPDLADYQVVLQPAGTTVGTVHEDFAVESLAGDIFQLGNASWRIIKVEQGRVLVEDAKGQPPTIPFWLGEAPARTAELSVAVSRLREEVGERVKNGSRAAAVEWLEGELGLPPAAAAQIADYLTASQLALGCMPSQETLVTERFFDEAGDMHLVVHAPFGSRLNKAWGLSLRKRFCQTFNFELQAAATENAIILSLGPTHSFPLEDAFHFLHSNTVRGVLTQAVLDAPLFGVRWRWNAGRALAIPRFRGGRKVPAPLLRQQSEDLIAVVFPDQLACLENIVGEREVPDHPLVEQTLNDCLEEAMDIEGLEALLRRIEAGELTLVARDVVEPSPLAHEVLKAQPYAFLDDAPLEERRTQAVALRRWLDPETASDLGALDASAIARVREEAWPEAETPDELHDALLTLGFVTVEEGVRSGWARLFDPLAAARRVTVASLPDGGPRLWVAAERLAQFLAVHPVLLLEPAITLPPRLARQWMREEALVELVRGRLEGLGPVSAESLAATLSVRRSAVEAALAALESEGFAFRGRFTPGATPGNSEEEWCERRLLARIHRYTMDRLRREIEPVSQSDYLRFLLAWQRVDPDERAEGPESLNAILEQLEGFEAAASAWEGEILPARMKEYDPSWLDALCLSGRWVWGRATAPGPNGGARRSGPVRATPLALLSRGGLENWREIAGPADPAGLELSGDARSVYDLLSTRGASFFGEIAQRAGLLHTQLEIALGELVAWGLVTSDSFTGLRALLVPAHKRPPVDRKRGSSISLFGMENAGRWSLLHPAIPAVPLAAPAAPSRDAVEAVAWSLLRRYGVVFRRLLERETLLPPWRDLLMVFRRLEARGEIRGGRFVDGFSGEQYALADAVGRLRAVRKQPKKGVLVSVSAADPLNLVGIATPGDRIPALAGNRLLFRDGEPIALLEGREPRFLLDLDPATRWQAQSALVRRSVAPKLKAYLGRSA